MGRGMDVSHDWDRMGVGGWFGAAGVLFLGGMMFGGTGSFSIAGVNSSHAS